MALSAILLKLYESWLFDPKEWLVQINEGQGGIHGYGKMPHEHEQDVHFDPTIKTQVKKWKN